MKPVKLVVLALSVVLGLGGCALIRPLDSGLAITPPSWVESAERQERETGKCKADAPLLVALQYPRYPSPVAAALTAGVLNAAVGAATGAAVGAAVGGYAGEGAAIGAAAYGTPAAVVTGLTAPIPISDSHRRDLEHAAFIACMRTLGYQVVED